MKTCTMVAVMLVGMGVAHADKPKLDEAKPAFAAIAKKVETDQFATPFLYDMLWHEEPIDAKGPCEKKWKAKGTLSTSKDLPAFVACLGTGGEISSLGSKELEWSELDLKKVPKPFAKYKSQLAKRAKDHLVLVAIVPDAGPAAHYYITSATKTAGKIQVDAWLHAYDDY